MIDPDLLKENAFKAVEENLKKRGYSLENNILEIVARRKSFILELEKQQHERNVLSKKIAESQFKKDFSEVGSIKKEVLKISTQLKIIKNKLALLEEEYQEAILSIPNILHPDVPKGSSEDDNILIQQVGEIPNNNFEVKPHYEIAESLRLIDFERGVRLAGSRFYIYNEQVSRLERNLLNMMLNIHGKRGYLERTLPLLVKDECMKNTGQLPKFRDEYYQIATDGLNLIPTAEVPLTNIYQNEILSESELPIYLCAGTPCFRREAGAAGRDTRGIIRVHQFQKVELVKLVNPEESANEFEKLLADVEVILKRFSLTYRILLLCSADTGFSSAKTYDLDIWFPGSQRWVEISSCSNFYDFQSRRAKIRFKDTSTGKNKLVHTLNASGVATGRLVAALLEYYQTEVGEISWEEIEEKIQLN